MSFNRQKFWAVLSKWPVLFAKKEYDYGSRLRELLKNKAMTDEIFPGTPVENSRKLDALLRLVNNSAKNEFSHHAISGACGVHRKEIKDLILQYVEMNKKTS